MPNSWTFFEVQSATEPVWKAFESLEARAQNGSRGQTPEFERGARAIQKYFETYQKIKATTDSHISSDLVKQIQLNKSLGPSRFYECRVGSWYTVFWIDNGTRTCVNCFSVYSSRGRIFRESVALALRNSPVISAMFAVVEKLVVQWLASERSIRIALDDD